MIVVDGPNGDQLRLATSLDELPWFQKVLKKAEADLMETPDRFLPDWVVEWKARQ